MKSVNILLLTSFSLLISTLSFSQAVTNGSINGGAPGNSNFVSVGSWTICPPVAAWNNSPDLCNVGFPSYNGITTVAAASSPDGGTWVGLANGVAPIEEECIGGTMTGLTIGNSYSLQFYGACFGVGAGNYANGAPCDVEVLINGTSTIVTIPMQALIWDTYCVGFTATATSMNFTVQNIAGGGYVGLDGFNVGAGGASINLGPDLTTCSGANFVLDATTPGATYLWQDNSTNPTFTATLPGTYWVEVSLGCGVARDTVIVTAGQAPTPVNLGNDTILCPGANLVLDATTIGATYLWQDNSTNPTFNVTQAGLYWVAADSSGCASSDTINVQYLTSFSLGNDTTLCPNQLLNLNVTIPGSTYLWQDNSTNSTYAISQAGTYWVEITSPCGVFIDTMNVSYNAVPVDLGLDTALCPGPAVVTLDATLAGATYLWHDASTNPTFSSAVAGTYWVDVTLNGCTNSDTLIVSDHPIPVPNLSADITICENGSTNLTANGVGGAAIIYHWNFTTNTNAVQTVSPTVLTNYSVFAENEFGCISAVENVTVDLFPPLNGVIPPTLTVCPNEGAMIGATASGGMGGNYTYAWSPGTTHVLAGPDAFMVYPTDTTTYTVTITDNCESTPVVLVITVNTSPLPEPTYFVQNPNQCEPGIFNISNTTSSGLSASVSWLIDGQTYNSSDNITTSPLLSGTYNIQMIVTTIDGCIDSTTFVNALYVAPGPTAAFTFSPNPVMMFDTDVRFINGSSNADSYQWSFQGGNPASSIEINPESTFPEGILDDYTVMLIAYSDLGCQDTAYHVVTVHPEVLIFAPNAFTPDGDEFNQGWLVHMQGIDIYDFELLMYNRWGELIWESHDIAQPWDATYNGLPVQSGIYSWLIRTKDILNDNIRTFNGHVNVLR